MGKVEVKGLSSLLLSYEQLGNLTNNEKDQMLQAGAKVALQYIRRKGEAYGVKRTGQTLDSLTISNPKDSTGKKKGRQISVTFKGKNNKGVRNAEVAFLNEYGRAGVVARPFIRDGTAEGADDINSTIGDKYDEIIEKKLRRI